MRDSAEYVFARLQAEDTLTNLAPDRFIERLGTYWGAIDSVHPFRYLQLWIGCKPRKLRTVSRDRISVKDALT